MNLPRRIALPVVAGLLAVGVAIGFENGSPGGYSGAPGEGTCISCHSSFPLNSGTALFAMTAPASLAGLAAVPIQLSFSNTTMPVHGFEVAVRTAAGATAGAWQITDPANTKLVAPNQVTHTGAGAQQTSWSTSWTPPAGLPAGPVRFYAAGLDGNDAGGSSGDRVYTTTATVYQAKLSTPSASWPVGTTQTLFLDAPTRGNDLYVVAISDSTVPSPLGGPFVLPVNAGSPLFSLVWTVPSLFPNFIGTLSPGGAGTAQMVIPNLPPLAGFPLHFAFATFLPGTVTVTEVSNRVSVTLM